MKLVNPYLIIGKLICKYSSLVSNTSSNNSFSLILNYETFPHYISTLFFYLFHVVFSIHCFHFFPFFSLFCKIAFESELMGNYVPSKKNNKIVFISNFHIFTSVYTQLLIHLISFLHTVSLVIFQSGLAFQDFYFAFNFH